MLKIMIGRKYSRYCLRESQGSLALLQGFEVHFLLASTIYEH